MVDLREVLNDEPEYPELLEPVRLGLSPNALLFFTAEADRVELHFIEDPAVGSYAPCPGSGCPICYCGDPPKIFFLLPVVNVKKKTVQVLRIPERRGPGALFTELAPHLNEEKIAAKLFLVSRDDFRYRVAVRPLGERADRCEHAISGFLKAQENGLKLTSAFPAYSAAELAEIEEIRTLLDAQDGWEPPADSGDA